MERVIGIDLGTTNSCVAIVENGVPTVIPNRGASELTSRAFRLKKGDGTIYDVAATAHGVTCDCPDYLFNRQDKDVNGCKHIKAMKACGLL